jgi:hypothetical protein
MTSPDSRSLVANYTLPVRSDLTVTSDSEAWSRVLRGAELLARRLDGEPRYSVPLRTVVSQLEACPEGTLSIYSNAVAELLGLVEQAHRLIALDPHVRDAFWALRDLISDITSGMESILDRASDPLFSSDETLDRYLASVRNADDLDLGAILRDPKDQARRRLVAALVYRLAWTRDAAGIEIWFKTPRRQLGNITPQAILDRKDADAARLLLPLARGSESEAASLSMLPRAASARQ